MGATITVHALFSKAILKEIDIDLLHSGIYQARDYFSQAHLESLSKMIEQVGVLEPLIVRSSSQHLGQFEIFAGERRHKAAKLAGLSAVPCLISNYSNEQAAQIALIENMSREGLNPIAEALAMERLATEFRYTHDEIGELLGVGRAQVTNTIRLLKLDARIQHWMKQGELSHSHGKIFAGLALKAYLNQWLRWWQKTSSTWNYEELSLAYIKSCWDPFAAKIAAHAFQQDDIIELRNCESIALAM